MSSISSNPTLSPNRIAAFTVIVGLSLALPLCIVYWSLISAFDGKPVGMNSRETKMYGSGSIKDRELWFPVGRTVSGNPMGPFDYRFQRLDLRTGIERETGLKIGGTPCGPFWVDDELFALGQTAIYQFVDSSLTPIAVLPAPKLIWPIRYDGHLTTVGETDDGGFQLLHLIDGEWSKGRSILLPGLDHAWGVDARTGQVRLTASALRPSAFASASPRQYWIVVRQNKEATYLFAQDHNGFCAYRNGFEFIDDESECASALALENSVREFIGWEQIPGMREGDLFSGFGCDQHGLLIAVRNWNDQSPSRVIRKAIEGNWKSVLGTDDIEFFGSLSIIDAADENAAYIVDEDEVWSFAAIYRIEGNTVLPQPVVVWGCVAEYFARWQRACRGFLLAWMIHLVVLVVGTHLINCRTTDNHYEFGIQHVQLASLWRRAFALLIDLLLTASIVVLPLQILLRNLNVGWKATDYKDLCRFLWNIEEMTVGSFPGGNMTSPSTNRTFLTRCVDQFERHPEIFGIVVTTTLAFCCMKLYAEGRFGITPGKWLLGIRTVRSTLRPCGIPQALLRNALYSFDILFLVTPIPALASILTSPQRQRIGDRFADTLVVKVNSFYVREHDAG